MPLINFSGLASGIDTESLIKATKDARRQQRVEPLEDKANDLEDTNTAFSDLKTLLDELKDIGSGFATLNGGPIKRQAQSSDETILTATASNSAAPGSYQVTVNSLATNEVISYNNRPTVSTAAILTAGQSGTMAVSIGTGAYLENFTINVNDTTTWQNVVDTFNSSTTNATASLINVGTTASPQYALTFMTNNVGEAQGEMSINLTGNVLTTLTGPANSDAADASFSVTGITGNITRSSNTVSDVIPGVTLNLESGSVSPVTLTVENDVTETTSVVKTYVDKYNEIVEFLAKNNQITREDEDSPNVFAPLANSSIDDGALTGLRTAMTNSILTTGTAIRILADLGVTTQRDGTLKFDEDKFEEAMGTDSEAVKEIFQNLGDNIGTTGGIIDQYTRFNGIIDVATQGNDRTIQDLQSRISDAEDAIAREEESMRQRFARLESIISRMQQQQSALTSALSGLGSGS